MIFVHNLNRLLARFLQSKKTPSYLTKKPFTNVLNINTNVAKDVILYKYDNPKFFKFLNIFALCQFGFWFYLSHLAYTTLRDVPTEKSENDPWWKRINLGENKYKNTITVLCFLVGYGILTVSWMYTLRSVRYLILRKGGSKVTIVTYGPLGKNAIMTVGLNDMSSKETRAAAITQLPIKVNNRYLHYMLDMKGEFKNPTLFDYTVGLKRNFKHP